MDGCGIPGKSAYGEDNHTFGCATPRASPGSGENRCSFPRARKTMTWGSLRRPRTVPKRETSICPQASTRWHTVPTRHLIENGEVAAALLDGKQTAAQCLVEIRF